MSDRGGYCGCGTASVRGGGMRLSIKQRDVALKMKKGWLLTPGRYLYNNRTNEVLKVSVDTVLCLITKGVIEHLMFQAKGTAYKFTEEFSKSKYLEQLK